ncbi:hypothetical protein CVT25_009171 [Psilocybe cyanescens]|uniref:Nephrocystin 3-like N-terminal domain-containing protein n=1 Tax=Psilocybe cyanescens TaxID=93625 RepID=A0A409VS24_PSICY|nr:hypothetical protein CVT25_009171 [Psilocybe cyanescens]
MVNTQDSDPRTAMFMVNAPMMITGGNFAISTGTPTPKSFRQVLVELFEKHVSLSATHDTIEDHNPPRCNPDSHRLLLERLVTWAEEPGSPPILWVFGPKRSGKTSIAGTFAEILQERNRLGATFFLNEDDRRASEAFLIPTIALQLSESIPVLQPLMVEVMQKAPFLFRKSLSTQMEQLIVRPILSLEHYDSNSQQVIIIDGIDSHHAPGSASRVLGVIHDVAPRLLGRARFLILSRPDKETRASYKLSAMSSFTHRIDLEIIPQSEQAQEHGLQSKKTSKTKPRAPSKTASVDLPASMTGTSLSPSNFSPDINTSSELIPTMPPPASSAYVPPSVPNRCSACAQQPTGVDQTNTNAANARQTFLMPIMPPAEEACEECVNRDLEMVDVDVTSPGAWERASDVQFEELKARQLEEEEAKANSTTADNANPTMPRAKGGRQLTEKNMKLLKDSNSREPTTLARRHIVDTYLQSQMELLQAAARAKLEAPQVFLDSQREAMHEDEAAEALARQQFLHECFDPEWKLLPAEDIACIDVTPGTKNPDIHMPDAHTELCRHAHRWDCNCCPSNAEGERTLLVPDALSQPRSHLCSETKPILLVKSEEERAQESCQGSLLEVTSIIAGPGSNGPLVESDLISYSTSISIAARLLNVLTSPLDRFFGAWTNLFVDQWP